LADLFDTARKPSDHLSTHLKALGFLAEMSLMLWRIVKRVNVQKWKEQARAAAG
jgi:TorA maturation chaperone TorD